MFNPAATRILIVDDFPIMRQQLRKHLSDLGFQDVVEAEDGRIAWETLTASTTPFQLLISDWNMPSANGIDLLRRVRADGRYKELPFILCTTENEKKAILEAVTAKVSNYIVKPYDLETLRQKLQIVYDKLYGA